MSSFLGAVFGKHGGKVVPTVDGVLFGFVVWVENAPLSPPPGLILSDNSWLGFNANTLLVVGLPTAMTEYARPVDPGAKWVASPQHERKHDVIERLRGHAAYCILVGVASFVILSFKSTKGIAYAFLSRHVA